MNLRTSHVLLTLITCLVLRRSAAIADDMLPGLILFSVRVWVSENTFSAFLIHSHSTQQHYPGTTRHVFAPVSTLLVLGWNNGTAWKEGRSPSRNGYLGGGEGREGGEGMVWVTAGGSG